MTKFNAPKNVTGLSKSKKQFTEQQYSDIQIGDKKYGPFITFVVIDKKRQKRNEEWLERMADMMIVRKYTGHSTEGRILPQNFGFIDVSCFGDQVSEALRYNKKKDLPVAVIFRPLIGGKPG